MYLSMKYTIKEMAELSGVSERTLRFWEEYGLLIPVRHPQNGYRLYGKKELLIIQQILFYRELEFSLKTIKSLLDDPNFEAGSALEKQRELLLEKRNKLDQLIQTITYTIQESKGEITMSDKDHFEGFKKQMIAENESNYGEEIRQKYGEETVEKANAQVLGMTEETYKKFAELGNEVLEKLQAAAKEGDPTSPLAREVASLHAEWLRFTWPHYSAEAHRGIVQMYTDDERFGAYYQGNAQFLKDAVNHFLDEE
nr:MerR family transcriptional regulator [uncultured Sphaerochaeta sp.]